MLIEHHKEHFSKVKNSNVWNDKVFDHANKDITRDRMFVGELTRDECNAEEVFQFLLLKRKYGLKVDKDDEINENENESRMAMKKAKRQSTSLTFQRGIILRINVHWKAKGWWMC